MWIERGLNVTEAKSRAHCRLKGTYVALSLWNKHQNGGTAQVSRVHSSKCKFPSRTSYWD